MRVALAVVLFFASHSLAVSKLGKCANRIEELSKRVSELARADYSGGFNTLGGFTIVDTRAILTPEIGELLLNEYRKVVPRDDSKTQQSYALSDNMPVKGPVANFMTAHKNLVLAVLNAEGENWRWEISSLLLLSQKLQDGFHDHMSDAERANPRYQMSRINAGVSLRFPGSVFQSYTDPNDVYYSQAGETSIFNEGALHQSPDGAELRFYLLHWFSRVRLPHGPTP